MIEKELEKSIKQFDLTSFFTKDTRNVHDYSAILVITNNQLILTENGNHGKDFHIDTLADICKIIYQIPISKSKSDWTNSVVQIEKNMLLILFGRDCPMKEIVVFFGLFFQNLLHKINMNYFLIGFILEMFYNKWMN